MSVDKFKFVSPGVFVDEIDESILPPLPERMGPVIIGRFQKGPSNRPVKVSSFKEFVNVFGNPASGQASGDIWRTGELTAPTYAAYAAQAWLRNNTPCTVVRLLGTQATNYSSPASTYPKAQAGWITSKTPGKAIASAGGAYGLFVIPSPDGNSGGAAAAMTINTLGSHATTAGNSLTLINTAGESLVFTSHASTTDGAADPPTFANGGDGKGGLANLKAAIEASSLSSSFDVSSASGTGPYSLTITQLIGGTAGNTTITSNCVNWSINGLGSAANASFLSGSGPAVTGSLAAVWYVDNGAVILTGTCRTGDIREGAALLIKSTDQEFTAKVLDSNANAVKTATFNFNKDSDKYIRKVFNTDPTRANSELAADSVNYWLGETFDTAVREDLYVTGTAVSDVGNFLGVVMGLHGAAEADFDYHDRRYANTPAKTGWFFSQDTRGVTTASFEPTTDTEKLFQFIALDSGEHANRDFKISIKNVKAPADNFNTWGSFSVQVREASDIDNNPRIIEQFSNVNLNPASANYIAKVIGNREYSFDSATNVLREVGDFPNRSKLIRVKVSDYVANTRAEGKHPYGVYGPAIPVNWQLITGSTTTLVGDNGAAIEQYVIGSGSLPAESLSTATAPGGIVHHGDGAFGNASFTASFAFPTTRTRVSSSEGNMIRGNKAYFGYQSNLAGTRRYDRSNLDLLRGMPASFNGGHPANTISDFNQYKYSWIFTLDEVKQSPDNVQHAVWVTGSRSDGSSFTAVSGSGYILSGTDAGYNSFTSPMFGGFDGLDITEADPFRNNYLDGGAETTNYAWYTIKKAVDLVSDAEFAEFDLAAMPGITNATLNTHLINTCEDRGDALAIIDLPGGHTPIHETTSNDSEVDRIGSVDDTLTVLKSMNINSSYGCAFYPFVQIRDMINDAALFVPPSVVALGTFSSSQRKSAVWFAPAGFTRGGLSEGSAGLPVIGVKQRLTATDRDKLYDANINPIATFPAEGIVIFGQKTLQVTQSALDRINVRRLMIFVKKEISRISSRLLFEQNVQATWDKFKGQVVPFLEDVKSGLGLTDFKVVLDTTTTTDDLVDRNILYAKIFLKPARSIEFIALDFIITRSGASFDD